MSYLTIVCAGPRNWSAPVPELNCIIVGKNRADILRLSRESISVALKGTVVQPPTVTNINQVEAEIRGVLTEGYEVLGRHLMAVPSGMTVPSSVCSKPTTWQVC